MLSTNFNIVKDRPFKAVVIGGSAGSFPEVTKILASMTDHYPYPIIMCLHRLRHVREGFVEALRFKSNIHVREPEDKELIKNGIAYLVPANYHLLIDLGMYFSLSTNEMVNFSRPSIDITLQSTANIYRDRLVGIILSGASNDGAFGMKCIKDKGGIAIIQKSEEAKVSTMPESVKSLCEVDFELSTEEIIEFLKVIHYEKNYN